MDALIKSLQIIRSYVTRDIEWPTHCEHDVLFLHPGDEFPWNAVSEQDKLTLKAMGWEWDAAENHFYSFKYGSC